MSDFITGSLDDFLSLIESGTRPKGGVNLIGDIPSFGGENVTDQGKIRFYPVKKISKRFFTGMTRGHLQDLDVIINKDGANTGKSTIYRNSPYRCATVNEHLFILRSKSENLDQVFLHNYFQWSETKREIYKKITGSAQPGLNSTFVDNFPVSFPPLREQQKIASILTSVDEVIEKTQSQINKLEDLKKATMNDLLTRGIGHTEFKDSELGRIPKSWGVSQNVDLCERIMVGVVITPAKFYVSIGVPVLRSANVKEGFITATDLKFFTNESNELMRKSILKVGDVLTVRTGYPGISAVVDKSFAGGNCVDLLISRPKSMICPDYLAYWINSDFGRGQVLKKQGGLAQQHFNVSELQALIVVLPPKEEQLKIVEILNSIDHQTKNISAKKINFINLKNSLMQDLLTGRVRVTVN